VAVPPAKTRRLIILALVGLGGVLFGIAVILTIANPSSLDLPVGITSISPTPSSNVLSQSNIVVDLASGYTGDLVVNGVDIPEGELFRVQGLNQLTFRPGIGQSFDQLLPDRNCVTVEYWLIAEGDEDRLTYDWCFDAS